MTKLPDRNVLDGSKLPKTTTGEMKNAFGNVRDYLNELLGDDSADKEAARLSLGIDLAGLNEHLSGKAERIELEQFKEEFGNEIKQAVREEILKRSVPVGSVHYFATAKPPVGYLGADGSAVSRLAYADLFTAIGTTFGPGDGTTTFNLPNLMGRFAEGNKTPGTVKEAGLPNVTGGVPLNAIACEWFTSDASSFREAFQGAFYPISVNAGGAPSQSLQTKWSLGMDLSRSNPIYGAANTVQPRALTLLPCIKAFDAASDPGLIDVSQLAQEMTGKLDKTVNGTTVKYVTDTYEDGKHWYRKWSDGWLEQGGSWTGKGSMSYVLTFPVPFQSDFFWIGAVDRGGALATPAFSHTNAGISVTVLVNSTEGRGFYWYACGRGA